MKTQISILTILLTFSLSGQINAADKENMLTEAEQIQVLTSNLIEENIKANLNTEVSLNGYQLVMAPMVYKFYELNNYKPVWSNAGNKELANQVINLIANAHYFGIDPTIFGVDYIEYIKSDIEKQKKTNKKSIRLTQFEFLLTNALFQYIVVLEKGYNYFDELDAFNPSDDYIKLLPGVVYDSFKSNDLLEVIFLQKTGAVYQNLQDKLIFLVALYEKIKNKKEEHIIISENDMPNFLSQSAKDKVIEQGIKFSETNDINNINKNRLAKEIYEVAEELNKIKNIEYMATL